MFITFEGLDGCGKTTLVTELEKYFSKLIKLNKLVVTREPGGTNLKESEKIRKFVLDIKNEIDPMSEAIAYLLSRRLHLEKIIWPALRENKIVFCDRFIDSSLAYQGKGRNLGIDNIKKLNEIGTNKTVPDLTFFIDLSPEDSIKRKSLKSKKLDRLEKESLSFFQDVYNGYKEIINNNKERFIIIDGKLSKKEIFEIAKKEIEKRIDY
ncbi:MAG: dTMP kinase [Metamycoplasmataceae bacterium]